MKNKIIERKNTLGRINSRQNNSEKQISELEDRVEKITASEQKKKKRMKSSKDNLRPLGQHQVN